MKIRKFSIKVLDIITEVSPVLPLHISDYEAAPGPPCCCGCFPGRRHLWRVSGTKILYERTDNELKGRSLVCCSLCLGCLEQLGEWYPILWAAQANRKRKKNISLLWLYRLFNPLFILTYSILVLHIEMARLEKLKETEEDLFIEKHFDDVVRDCRGT